MKTLSQLKKDLKPGTVLRCTYHFIPHMLDKERIIEKVNTVEIKYKNGVCLRRPQASLLKYDADTFSIYDKNKKLCFTFVIQ